MQVSHRRLIFSISLLVAIAIALFSVLALRPLALLGLALHPLGFAVFGALGALLSYSIWTTFVEISKRRGISQRELGPLAAFLAFIVAGGAAVFPAQVFGSQKLGIEASWDTSGAAVDKFLVVFNDDFGGNALPRPDSMLLVDLSDPVGISITPVLRDWTFSSLYPDRTLADVHFGILECEPYCELKDLAARVALERGPSEGPSTQSLVAAEVIQLELGLDAIRVLEVNPETVEQLFSALAPIEVEVFQPIPVGGKWIDEQMVDIRYWIPSGLQELSSEEMLWFARARWTSSNDDRVARQLQLVQALFDQRSIPAIFSGFASSKGLRVNLSPSELMAIDISLGKLLASNLQIREPLGE